MFADSEGETEVSEGDDGADLFAEHLFEEVLFLEFLGEEVVAEMGVGAVGHDGAVLYVLAVGVVGAGDFELVVVEEGGGGVDLRKGRLVFAADHPHERKRHLRLLLQGGGDGVEVVVILGRTGDEGNGAEAETGQSDHQII
jgi:hypothetical protein